MLKSFVFLTTNQDLVKDKTITNNSNFPKTKTVPQSLLFSFLTFLTLKARNSNYQRSLRNASETFMTYTGHWNISTMTITFSTRDTRSFITSDRLMYGTTLILTTNIIVLAHFYVCPVYSSYHIIHPLTNFPVHFFLHTMQRWP